MWFSQKELYRPHRHELDGCLANISSIQRCIIMACKTNNAQRSKIIWRTIAGVLALVTLGYFGTFLLSFTHGTIFPNSNFQRNSGIKFWTADNFFEAETVNYYLSTSSVEAINKWYQSGNWDGHDTTWRDFYYRSRQIKIGSFLYVLTVKVSVLLDTHPAQIEVSYRFFVFVPR